MTPVERSEAARQILRITPNDLQMMSPDGQGFVKSLMQIRQSLYDLLGAYPQDNILPYVYSFSLTTAKSNALTALGTASTAIRISADSAMVVTQITGSSSGDYLIFPRTDASDRQIVNEAVNSSAFVGTGERPHYLPKPLLLEANTSISFDLTDLSNAVNEVYFSLVGYKVYARRGR
jgi:hypothetical protein